MKRGSTPESRRESAAGKAPGSSLGARTIKEARELAHIADREWKEHVDRSSGRETP